MKALIITFGTEGDVRPMAALGAALGEAGHAVQFLATEDTAEAARALAVPTAVLPGAVRAPLGAAGTTGNANSAAALARVVNDNTSAWLKLALEHGAGCDVVIAGGLAAFVGFSAAEKLGVPGVGAAMFPITPTAAFASPFFPPGGPAWANRLTHRIANGLVWRSFARATNAARREVGLSTGRRVWTDNPALYGFSPRLVPRPADWPANAAVCGLWAKPTTDWTPPDSLAAFLDAGEPPIYVGFGSMTLADPRRLLAALTAGIAGRRALFYPGWSGIAQPDLPPNFHAPLPKGRGPQRLRRLAVGSSGEGPVSAAMQRPGATQSRHLSQWREPSPPSVSLAARICVAEAVDERAKARGGAALGFPNLVPVSAHAGQREQRAEVLPRASVLFGIHEVRLVLKVVVF